MLNWMANLQMPLLVAKQQNNVQNKVFNALFTFYVNNQRHITRSFCHFTKLALVFRLFSRFRAHKCSCGVLFVRVCAESRACAGEALAARSDGGSRLRGSAEPPATLAPHRAARLPLRRSHRYSDCDDNVPIYVFGHG